MQTPYKVSQIGRPVFLHLEDDKRQIYVKKKLKRLQNQVHNVFSLEGWGGGGWCQYFVSVQIVGLLLREGGVIQGLHCRNFGSFSSSYQVSG